MTNTAFHRFNVGSLVCHVLADMTDAAMTIEKLTSRYPHVSREDVVAALKSAGPAVDMTGGELNTFAVKSGDTQILMDTGMGENAGDVFGHQLANLKAAGLDPADVDIVVITHFHPDHTFGLLDATGTPTYPNARYLCHESEMNWWFSDAAIAHLDADRVNPIRASVAPLKDQFTFVAGGEEIAPGVQIVDMFGHSPGHIGLLLESEGERLLHVVDLLHGVVQLGNPDWHHIFDGEPDQAVETRRAVLARAADENLLTAFYHLPFPGFGHVTRKGDAFYYAPFEN